MKERLIGLAAIAAALLLTSSCVSTRYYSSATYGDDIYYRPTADSRARMVNAMVTEQESRKKEEFLAQDDNGNLYLITEYANGESYETRLHKFDSPVYSFSVSFGPWGYPWYNPWWGTHVYPYGPYWASFNWRVGLWWDPWIYPVWDPFFPGPYGPGWGPFRPWGPYHPAWGPYYPGWGPAPIVVHRGPVVNHPRSSTGGGGTYRQSVGGPRGGSSMYRQTASSGRDGYTGGNRRTGTQFSVSGTNVKRTSSSTYGGNGGYTTGTTSGRKATRVRGYGSSSNTKSSSSSRSYGNSASGSSRSNGGYSSGYSGSRSSGGYSGGGGGYSGGGYSGGNAGGGGSHSGGGRR